LQVYMFELFRRLIAKLYDRSSAFQGCPKASLCGIQGMLCSFIFNLVLCLLLRFLYMRENKKRYRMLEGKSVEEVAAMKAESNLQGVDLRTLLTGKMYVAILSTL
jgi:hypothetical protein